MTDKLDAAEENMRRARDDARTAYDVALRMERERDEACSELEAAKTTLRNIAALTDGPRHTVSEETAWPAFQASNEIVVKVRELARAALEGQGEAR